mgnify:CR=1 FL=1
MAQTAGPERAATIYRELQWRGVTVRSQIDVLVAAVAIRLGLPVLFGPVHETVAARRPPGRPRRVAGDGIRNSGLDQARPQALAGLMF